jgi:Oxygen-sensitive ribonucleoside-triphosphate reductase
MAKKPTNHIKFVIKRDGKEVPFDKSRIEEAIFKALTATGEGGKKDSQELTKKVVTLLNRRFKKDEKPHVEQIQDIVEEVLILENFTETAKAYILYREQRRQLREAKIATEEAMSLVDDYLNGSDWEIKENSNMAFSLQGLNHYVSSYVIKKYWLNRIYPQEIRKANEEGDLHLHNLDI